LALLLAGCSDKPKAPALSNDPVYHNSREGFRFAVPEGWTQTANANFPAEAADQERMLVRYAGSTGDGPATLEVSCLNISESADLNPALDAPSHSIRSWKREGSPESIQIHDEPATRCTFRSGETVKEVVVFRRAGRAYFFTGLHSIKDGRSRELIRRAVESVVWTK
jgi:hypothetical protein